MDELFGVSMNTIAAISLALTTLMLAFVGLIAIRNPVMFKMGLRNIPRRPAQTALIIIGLMLSTLIVTAAFGTGDTISTSITAEVYRTLGETDEIIDWDAQKQPAPLDQQVVPLQTVAEWRQLLAANPDIEALVPFQSEVLPIRDSVTGLNESAVRVVGFRGDDALALGGLRDVDGKPVELGRGEIAVNKRLAELIDSRPGNEVVLLYEGTPVPLRVVAIVPNQVLGGAFTVERAQGAAVDYDVLAELTGKQDVADGVFVSNTGDVKGGLKRTDAVMVALEDLVEGTPYRVTAFKQDGINTAKLFGSLFTSFFVVLGLFSIAAGVLLIFLIFIMLAAERQPEMGMARAVGAKRRQIVESFLAEGMGYDLGSAVFGLVAGMGATAAMVAALRAFVGDDLGLSLDLTFTPRSLIVSFCLGLLATFLVIFAASWRASRLNIVAAIRDLPEARPINPEDATALGYLRAVLNGLVLLSLPLGIVLLLLGPIGAVFGIPAVVVGLVSPWLYVLRASDFSHSAASRTGEPAPRWPWFTALPVVTAIGYAIALGMTRVARDRRPGSVPRWLLAISVVVPPLGIVLVVLQDPRARIAWAAGLGGALGLTGALLVALGMKVDQQFPFAFGISLVLLFVATALRYFHVHERASFTACGVALLAFWYVAPAGVLEPIVGELNGNIEMFFLSGFAMVTAGTFIVVYNADIILPAVGAAGSRFGRIVPAMKTGVAYPLSARFRTGMTIAMIGLITFALVVNASLNENFLRLFLNEDTKGGWDIRVVVNSNNRLEDPGALAAAFPSIARVGEVRLAFPFEAEVENLDGRRNSDREVLEYMRYTVLGVDRQFIEGSDIKLKARAAGFASDSAVWSRLAADPTVAILPAAITSSEGGFGGDPERRDLVSFDPVEDGFEPFTVRLREPGGRVTEVTVIGQMKEAADPFWGGIMMQADAFRAAFPESRGQQLFLGLRPGENAEKVARVLERELVQASVESLQQILDDQARISNGFMLIFQGFMGLGLIIGIAALAVIAFRSVVERRQQIGMLRAIGYKRGMVALSFVFESGFTAAAGIGMGLVLGLSLAWVLFVTGSLGPETKGNGFAVPWIQLGVITGVALVASLVMTIIPARQASGVPVAEALRYE